LELINLYTIVQGLSLNSAHIEFLTKN
jgi:hypothetical protein